MGTATRITPARQDRASNHRFDSLGDQLLAIRTACSPGTATDVRLAHMAAAQGMNSRIPSEGGFALVPTFAETVWDELSARADNLLSRTDNYPVEGEQLTLIANAETSRATGSRYGGVRGYWINEADQLTNSTPKVRGVTLEPKQLSVLIPVTEKLLRNARALERYVRAAAEGEMNFLTNVAIVAGTGAGTPKGLLASGSTISVAKESGQAAATINPVNIGKMIARLHPSSYENAVWLANVNAFPQLAALSTTVMNVAATENVGGFASPLYDPSRRTLNGWPVIPCEACPTLGTVGDLILTDLSAYATGTSDLEGVASIHARFEYAESMFRFIFAVDGQPWLASALTPYQGADTLSTCVTLATRA